MTLSLVYVSNYQLYNSDVDHKDANISTGEAGGVDLGNDITFEPTTIVKTFGPLSILARNSQQLGYQVPSYLYVATTSD